MMRLKNYSPGAGTAVLRFIAAVAASVALSLVAATFFGTAVGYGVVAVLAVVVSLNAHRFG